MSIAGVVLAAGLSTRMGESKAGLLLQGKSLLGWQLEALKQASLRPILVVVSSASVNDQVRSDLQRAEVVLNPKPEEGPISSLRLALKGLDRSVTGAVVCPVDQGPIQVETLRELREALLEAEATVVVPRFLGRVGHPVGFASEVFEVLQSPLANPGANAVVASEAEAGRVMYVDVDDPGVIRNLNTPEDFKALVDEFEPSP